MSLSTLLTMIFTIGLIVSSLSFMLYLAIRRQRALANENDDSQ